MAQLLKIGNLQLSPTFTVAPGPASTGYAIEAAAEGMDFGSPESVEVVIETLIRDGAVVITEGYMNREVTFLIQVRGNTAAMATAEAVLFAELGKRNTLSWTPADGFGATCVFQVLTSSFVPYFDDLAEQQPLPLRSRTYQVRFVCAPFAQEATNRTVDALVSGGSPTSVSVDAGSSTSGWTGSSAVSVVSGAVGCVGPNSWLERAGVVDMSVNPFLIVTATFQEWPLVASSAPLITCLADGVVLDRVSTTQTLVGTVLTYVFTFYCPDPSVSTFRFNTNWASATGAGRFAIDQITKSNQAPIVGNGRQKNRSALIAGSARTQGIIHLTAPEALGDVLLYAYDQDPAYQPFLPSLSTRRQSGPAITTDTTMVSNGRQDISVSGIQYRVRGDELPPGSYVLMAKLMRSTAGTRQILNSVAQIMAGSSISGGALSATLPVVLAITSVYEIVKLKTFDWPLIKTPNLAKNISVMQIDIFESSASATILDEAWLFNLTTGELTQVKCGTGAPGPTLYSNHLWVASPDITNPNPSIYIGSAADMSDARYPTGGGVLSSWGDKTFTPPAIGIYHVTTNTPNANADVNYPARFHTHVA